MHSITRFLPSRMVTTQILDEPLFIPIKAYNDTESVFKRETLLLDYQKPLRHDMLVIIPFFNPCNSMRLLQNLLFVVNKFNSNGIPYVIAHCLFPDSNRIMPESSSYFVVQSSSYAFLKENLANIAIDKYRDVYSKFVVMDGDIIFDNKIWYDELSSELDNSDIVQPYTTYHHLDYNFASVTFSGKSIFSIYDEMKVINKKTQKILDIKGHPGYVIAFTIDYIDNVGYPHEALIGGGDTLTCSIALKTKLFGGRNRKHFEYLYDKYVADNKNIKTKSLQGAVYHLYHNVLAHRQYTTRYNILNKYINDDTPYNTIDDLICKNKDGIYEWKEEIREAINQDMLDYFSSRQDDEVVKYA